MRTVRVTVNGKVYTVEVGDLSRSPITVVVDGETFQVEIEKPPPPLRAAPPPARAAAPPPPPPATAPRPAPAAPAGAGAVVAPMPGKILSVSVQVGARIASGQELCVLEAMKMGVPIKATRDGIVREIRVSEGQSVSHGEVLVVLA